jgi:hypothetical protein
MSKTRLITTGGTSRMIAATKLHKRSREDGAARLVASCETTTLAVKVAPVSANKPVVSRHKSEWGDSAKADRRGRDLAAARAEARREAQPARAIRPLFG